MSERFAALQYRDFRLLWFGRFVSSFGSQMQTIALSWHVFELLRAASTTVTLFGRTFSLDSQALGLGALGLVRIIPVAIFALLGGVTADARDRRKLLIATQAVAAVTSLILAVITLTDRATLSWVYAMTAVAAATTAFTNPAQQSLVPNLVAPRHLSNAISLDNILLYAGNIIGPGIAGLLVSRYGIGTVYAIDAISFAAVIIALTLIRYRSTPNPDARIDWGAIREGVRFTYRNKLIWSTMLLDFWATFFGSARSMLPLVADRILGMGVEGYGLLATAQPLGAVVAGFGLALRGHIRRQGAVLLLSVALYGLATALFGLTTVFGLSYLFFALTGTGDMISTVIRGTLRQLETPDTMRGRMTSVNMLFYLGGPQLGEVEAGLVAAAFGAPVAIVSGGVATIVVTGWVAWRYAVLRRYQSNVV